MKKSITFFVFMLSFVGISQNMVLDTSFGNNGLVVDNTINEVPLNVFFENNKYILVLNNGICSRNYDGSKDITFGSNGIVTFSSSTETFYTKGGKLQNGFIYVFGQVSNNSSSVNKNIFIAKISTLGVLDTTFGTNGLLKLDLGSNFEIINDVFIKPDGKIVAVGNKNAIIFMTKINSNGTLDTSFNVTGYKSFIFDTYEDATGASIYNYQGNYLLVGSSSYPANMPNSTKYLELINIDENGDFINSFGTNGVKSINLSNGDSGSYNVLNSKLISNNLYFTYHYSWSWMNQHDKLFKYNIQTENLSQITYMPNRNFDYIFDENENIFITGSPRCDFTPCNRFFDFWKRNSSGALDLTFNSSGIYTQQLCPVHDDYSSVAYIHNDGKIFVGGYSHQYYGTQGMVMIRIEPSNSLSNNEFDLKNNFIVFPNPANKLLSITSKLVINIDNIEIIDANGRQISVQNSNFEKVNIENLQQGIYFINIFYNDKKTTLKFIKN